MTQIRNLRWWIAGLLAIATALSYLDRQSFPVAVSRIREDIPLTDQQFSMLNSLFLLAYAIMYMGGGKIMLPRSVRSVMFIAVGCTMLPAPLGA